MTEPIGPSHHIPLSPSTVANIPLLSNQMQKQVLALAEHLQKILEDPSLSTQESFLREVTTNGNQLNQTVEQSLLIR
jgi:hypothetical protein